MEQTHGTEPAAGPSGGGRGTRWLVAVLVLVALVLAGFFLYPPGKPELARPEAPKWLEEAVPHAEPPDRPADVEQAKRPRRLSEYPASKDPPAYGLPLVITISDVPEVPAEIYGPTLTP